MTKKYYIFIVAERIMHLILFITKNNQQIKNFSEFYIFENEM